MPPALAAVAGLLLSAAPAGLGRLDLRPGVDGDASAVSLWLAPPSGYVQLGETLYFVASTPGEGQELWGASAAGGEARLVVDLAPGAPWSSPEPLVVLDGRLFFAAWGGVGAGRGARVFESDGTARGTRRSSLFPEEAATDAWQWSFQFLDMHPGRLTATFHEPGGATAFYQSDGHSPAARLGAITGRVTPLLALPERLLVLRTDGPPVNELWAVGGGGAERLTPDFVYLDLHGALGPRAFFSLSVSRIHPTVDPDTAVVGLWVTDGTAAGTLQLSSSPGARGGAVAGGKLYYFADDGNLGSSLWRTDGTVAGTEAVLSGLEAPEMMGAFGERAVFRSLRDFSVWASDGTSAGTRRIGHSFAATPRIAVRPGAFYFVGVRDFDSSGSTATGTKALARSDGSPEGTAFVPLPEGRRLALDGNLAPVEAGLAVTTERPAGGTEAWILAPDGSWRLLAAFGPVPGSSAPYELEALGDRIVFGADDGAHGKEPWVSDGSAAGSSLLADLAPGTSGSTPRAFRATGGVARFRADLLGAGYDGVPHETDGTPQGTRSLAGRWMLGEPLLPDGARWYVVTELVAGSYPGLSLYRYLDGAESRIFGPSLDGPSSGPLRVGDRVLFTSRSSYDAGGLFATTGGAPERLADMGAMELVSRGDVALFRAHEYYSGSDLWRTDGTAAGTFPLGVKGQGVVLVEGVFYFAGDDALGTEPWASDGTVEGTRRLADLAPGAASSRPSDFAAAAAGVVFAADPGGGPVLFAAGGSAGEPRRISDVRPGLVAERGPAFSPLEGGVLAFAGWDPDGGLEPWVTNGTAAGTGRLADLVPGTGSSDPGWFTRAGDRVFFAAHDEALGRELHVLPLAAFPPGVPVPPGTRDEDAPRPGKPDAPAVEPGGGGGCGGCASGGDGSALVLAFAAALALRGRRRRVRRS